MYCAGIKRTWANNQHFGVNHFQRRNLKMTKPLCPYCGKGMYRIGLDLDPSVGLQTEEWQCYSLNTHHRVPITQPIPGWDNFREKSTPQKPIPPTARRIAEEDKIKILSLLNQGMTLQEVAYETGYSDVAVWRIRAITTVAAVSTAIRGTR